jgi:hypothetical protein
MRDGEVVNEKEPKWESKWVKSQVKKNQNERRWSRKWKRTKMSDNEVASEKQWDGVPIWGDVIELSHSMHWR